ncbi:nucleotidyltransferase domain-containing protein [bacterium]|nr:nucleotidyltransferase domain-containing protein [candidate division CSSED10-310 bacterium]
MGIIFDQLIKRFPDYPHLKAVETFVNNVTDNMDPLLIIMFGALPRDDYTHNSDVDILLIFEHPVTWNEIFSYGTGVIQPISKTRVDFIDHLKKGNAFFIQILEEGIVLYSREDVLEELKDIASRSIQQLNMARVEKGWDDEDYEDEE